MNYTLSLNVVEAERRPQCFNVSFPLKAEIIAMDIEFVPATAQQSPNDLK